MRADRNVRPTQTLSRRLPRAVAGASLLVAVAGFGEFAVRTDARLRIHAPVQAFIRGLHGRVGLGLDELSLPAQRCAEVGMRGVEAFEIAMLVDHA